MGGPSRSREQLVTIDKILILTLKFNHLYSKTYKVDGVNKIIVIGEL